MCGGNEAFYIIMYLRAFHPGPAVFGVYLMTYLAVITFPIAFIKSAISLIHLFEAAQTVVKHDVEIITVRNSAEDSNTRKSK